jgi:hypothetical protein
MRPPFWMDKLSPQDRATVKHWYAFVGGVYAALSLGVAALVVTTTGVTRPGPGLLATDAVAAERTAMSRCAAREIKLLTDIERAGESGTVPAERVYRAFVTMLDARSVCAAGRLDEALALYDDAAALAPVQSAEK